MRRMITDKLTKNIKEVVAAYQAGEIAEVVANPTLAGDEAELTGLQVGDTKYAMPQGGSGSQLYAHNIGILLYTDNTKETAKGMITATIISSDNAAINDATKLATAITSIQSAYRPLSAYGSDGTNNVFGLYNESGAAAYIYFDSVNGSVSTVAISADTS